MTKLNFTKLRALLRERRQSRMICELTADKPARLLNTWIYQSQPLALGPANNTVLNNRVFAFKIVLG